MIRALLHVCLILLSSSCVYAQTYVPAKEEEKDFEEKLIDKNIEISEWFDGVAEGLDLFLAGGKLTDKKNDTRIDIEHITIVPEREAVTNDSSFNVNLRLPNVEEHWQLKFTSYDETKERRAVTRANPQQRPARQRDLGATLGLFKKLGNIRAAFQPRISFQDRLVVSHSLAFESIANMKTYDINPKLELFAKHDDGTGVFMGLNFHYHLSKKLSFTWVNDGEYLSKTHVFSASNGVSLGQSLTRTTSLSYNWFFDSNNREAYHLESYTVSVGWYELIYKNIFDYRITPYVAFPEDRAFAGTPGISLAMAVHF